MKKMSWISPEGTENDARHTKILKKVEATRADRTGQDRTLRHIILQKKTRRQRRIINSQKVTEKNRRKTRQHDSRYGKHEKRKQNEPKHDKTKNVTKQAV